MSQFQEMLTMSIQVQIRPRSFKKFKKNTPICATLWGKQVLCFRIGREVNFNGFPIQWLNYQMSIIEWIQTIRMFVSSSLVASEAHALRVGLRLLLFFLSRGQVRWFSFTSHSDLINHFKGRQIKWMYI